jgi:hypothetical protein
MSLRMTISKTSRDGILLKSLRSKTTMTWHGCSHRRALENSKISTRRRRSPRETRRAKSRNLLTKNDSKL